MQHASRVIYDSKLVGKIQRRMVRVLISLVQVSSYEKKFYVPKAKAPTMKDLMGASSHNIETSENRLRCRDCAGSVCRTSPKVRNWLKAKCLATPFDDSKALAPIPSWHPIQLKYDRAFVSSYVCVQGNFHMRSVWGIWGAKVRQACHTMQPAHDGSWAKSLGQNV